VKPDARRAPSAKSRPLAFFRMMARRMRGYEMHRRAKSSATSSMCPPTLPSPTMKSPSASSSRAHRLIQLASGLINRPVAVPWWNGRLIRLLHLDVAPAFEWREHHEEICRASALVLVIMCAGRLGFIGSGTRVSAISCFEVSSGKPAADQDRAVAYKPPARLPWRPRTRRWPSAESPTVAGDGV